MKQRYYIIASFIFITLISGLYAHEKLTILHWNDFHSRNIPYYVNSDDSTKILIGGYATLAGYINSIHRRIENVALIHAGDDFQGSPICTITKGLSQIELLNIIKPDVFTLGNHEFDYGKENLHQVIMKAKFPIISANIFDKSTGELFVKPYLIKKYGKIKVGYIGLLTTRLKQLSLPENVSGIQMLEPAQVVRKYTSVIKDSVDIIIIVSHMGLNADKRLASQGSGFQVIIGGHSHSALFNPIIIDSVIICQAGSKGKYLGRLDLLIDTEKDKIINYRGYLIKTTVKGSSPDLVVQAKVDNLEKQLDVALNKVIGVLRNDWKRVSQGESNVGNWQTDVMREFAGTDIAFQNSGGIRKDISAGNITVRDMWELNPFSNHFVVFELTGVELRKAIERNCEDRGEFLQVSGVKYIFNKNRPVGNRVINIWINGKLLDKDSTYSICTNNFLTDHFYHVFGISPKGISFKHIQQLDRDIFIEAVKKQRTIDSKIEGRIVSID